MTFLKTKFKLPDMTMMRQHFFREIDMQALIFVVAKIFDIDLISFLFFGCCFLAANTGDVYFTDDEGNTGVL